MPVSKKRKKKGQERYLDSAQLAQQPKTPAKLNNQQIAILVISGLIIFAMATSLIFSSLAPTSTTQPITNDTTISTDDATSGGTTADDVEESTE